MTRSVMTLCVTALCAFTATAAMASPECTQEPTSKWIPADKMQAQLKAQGYQIKKFKTEDSCYEIYGKDKDGHRVEIYFDPVSGKPVKIEKD
mgnify:FL=1